jgi:hypothetical protein
MKKEQVVELFRSHGYTVAIEDGIPIVSLPEMSQREFGKRIKEIRSLLKDNGYNQSFGWRIKQNVDC